MRRSALLLLAPVAALGLVACSSSDDSGSSTTTTAAPSTTSTTSGGGSSSSSTSTTEAAPQPCPSSSLAGSLGPSNAGAGQLYQPLVLRNTGSTACELRGFPGVSVLDSSGTQIGEPATRDGAEGAAVLLEPGGAASALLHTNNGPVGGPCEQTSASMRVYPPNQTEALTFAAEFTVCGGFSVTSVVAGETGTAS